jgi:hypothetical protein
MRRGERTRRPERGQATVENVAMGAVLALLLAAAATSLAGADLARDVTAALAGTVPRSRVRQDDAWALRSRTYGPLIRRYAPALVLERDVWRRDRSVPVDFRLCRRPACAAVGVARPTAFVHLVRRPDATYIQYWLYYPDSVTNHLPLRALRGEHRDDWEGVVVRVDGRGAWGRATAHGGFQGDRPWWDASSGWRRLDGAPVVFRAAGSHAGGFAPRDLDLAGDDWNGALATLAPSTLDLQPADAAPFARRRFDPGTSAPWRKRAWTDPEVPGTGEDGSRGVAARHADGWALTLAVARVGP